jgi:hypothetical protein
MKPSPLTAPAAGTTPLTSAGDRGRKTTMLHGGARLHRRDRSGRARVAGGIVSALVLVSLFAMSSARPAFSVSSTITPRGNASSQVYASDSTTTLTLTRPAGAVPGDVLIASLGIGKDTAKTQPTLTPPAGWTLVTRTNKDNFHALAVYWHAFAAGESTYTWTTSVTVGGSAFISAFGGVDTTQAIDVSKGAPKDGATAIPAPSVKTRQVNEMLVASFYGFNVKSTPTQWAPPTGMTEIADAANSSGSRTGSVDYAIQAAAGDSGNKTANASFKQDRAIAVLTALRPGNSSAGAPVISSVAAGSLTSSGATIGWVTDQLADSQVEYGLTTAYGSATSLDSVLTASHSEPISGLAAGSTYHYRVSSQNASGQMATSGDFTFQTAAPSGPVPLILDTDIFSSADDAGAMAIAFGLQLKGEDRVIAVGVNTRTSRPAVATNSWKCTAAIAQFYQAGATPIGTAMPNNGTEVNTVDFVGPCAALASPSTPIPDSAVNVYRRALVAQPDASVVMVGTGYSQNLSALLNSPADSISPLSGNDLITQKVRLLVIMAGGYPSRNGENNLIGDPASAQNVADNWPTKIVWSGYEVGDAIHTGNTISGTHPTSSPLRVAYEAFARPNNWIYSYDLTAVYHAVRPSDSLLSEVGPGTNAVNSSGGNVFTPGAGNQYYLSLSDATALDSSIEALLDTLPGPVISSVAAGSVTTSGATIGWVTDQLADSRVEYGLTTAYGSATSLDPVLTVGHSEPISGLTVGTTYHYRVSSRNTSGQLATSGDFTFQTAGSTGPSDTFDSNSIDPAKWVVTSAGSNVAAVNQELEITHVSGAWTTGTIQSVAPYNETGRAVQVQLKRAANNGLGGATFGETTIYLWVDATHYVQFFVASGSLSAWVNSGSGQVNLTPNWPAYTAVNMQWLRFRESGGTLYWEYAAGATSPGTWTVLASIADPFPLNAVTYKMKAGSNNKIADTASFDNVSTS